MRNVACGPSGRAPGTVLIPGAARPAVVAAAVSPALFVVLWSTGFVATKIGLRDSPPLPMLALRFAGAALILGLLAWRAGVLWPRAPRVLGHLFVAGTLTHTLYVGFSFEANAMGMPASVLALVGVLNPVLTAVGAAWLLRERVGAAQWAGLGLGCAGVVLVLFERVAFTPTAPMVACAFASTLALTAGTLYQKRFCAEGDLLSSTALQFVGAAAVTIVASGLREGGAIHWHAGFVAALGWLVAVNSVASTLLLYWLIRRGAASRVTSLFYLVPVATSIMAYFMVDEAFGRHFLAGTAMTILGVMLALRARPGAGARAPLAP